MSQRTQHWLPSEQFGVPVDCNRTDKQLIQDSWIQGCHSAAPSELQEQPVSPQEIFSAPYPSYTSHSITPVDPPIHDAHSCISMVEEQGNMAPEHESQGSADITDQFHLSFGREELSSLGDGLLLIPSNGATGSPTPSTTTDLSAHSPVGSSTAGPRIIELVAAENDLRAVGSPQIQQAAGKRRKKDGIYQCQFRNAGCNATFTALHNLRYHLNAHRGLKPYKCSECPFTANSPSTVKRHAMKRHPSSYKGTQGHTI
ncbi:hypothetical protein JOM56_014389 [Amanita muscaria]